MVKPFVYDAECFNERADEFLLKNTEEGSVNSDELLQDLTDTLKSATDRLYICANEIGVPVRAFCLRVGEEIKEFFNPIFQKKENIKLIRELDPSDGKEYIIPRPTEAAVCYLTKDGKERALRFDENSAPVIGQAMDCLDGLHDKDYGLEIIPEFNQATEEEQLEVVKEYVNSLTKFSEDLSNDLKTDEELSPYWTSFKFNMAKARGEIEVENQAEPKNRKQKRLFKKFMKKFGGKRK